MTEMMEAKQEASEAEQALDQIRTALDDEIDVSVVPELTSAFQIVLGAINNPPVQAEQGEMKEAETTEAEKFTLSQPQIDAIQMALGNITGEFSALGNEINKNATKQALAARFMAISQRFSDLAVAVLPDKGVTFDVDLTSVKSSPFAQVSADQYAKLPDGYGDKIGIVDRNGKQLRVGDKVRVFDSSRFGNPTGVVTGLGDDDDDDNEAPYRRPRIKLDNGEADEYQPSAQRVERLWKVKKPEVQAVAEPF